MNEALQVQIRKMNPHAGHVVVLGRGDGKVLILGTANPQVRLHLVIDASPLEHEVCAIESEHFRTIAIDLGKRFRHLADDCYGHWVMAEYSEVIQALGDYDTRTGARWRSGNVGLGQTVWVTKLGRGEVTEFESGRSERVRVRMHFGGVVGVPRSYVKPILRASA